MDDSLESTIGEVARRAGVATSSIRYYESIGVLPEPARLHGQRRYGSDVLGRLAFVDVAQGAGFKLEEIKELMRSADGDGGMAAPAGALDAQARRRGGAARAHGSDEAVARGGELVRLQVG